MFAKAFRVGTTEAKIRGLPGQGAVSFKTSREGPGASLLG